MLSHSPRRGNCQALQLQLRKQRLPPAVLLKALLLLLLLQASLMG